MREHLKPPCSLNVCVGFPVWKRPHVKPFFRSLAGREKYIDRPLSALEYARCNNGRLVIWASREKEELTVLANREGVDVVRMEDGFLRSVGLGSDFYVPYSLVLDRRGIYYDPSRPSDLEDILERGGFDSRILLQARHLRKEIIWNHITKYNFGKKTAESLDLPPGKRIVLVPGQVEDDASVRRGASGIDTNLRLLEAVREVRPAAFIVYKPHPDVVTGNRPGRISGRMASRYCDKIVENTSPEAVLEWVDEVHTISSLIGFEALLRGKDVHTYGGPFYAGWGLTTDLRVFPRRTRRVSLDELVAATLILYPTYYDWQTRMFCGPEVVLQRLANESGRRSRFERILPKSVTRCFRILLQPYIK